MSMIYRAIPPLNLKLVTVKVLAVVSVCVFFSLLFVCFVIFQNFGILFRPMFPLEDTVPLRTGVI